MQCEKEYFESNIIQTSFLLSDLFAFLSSGREKLIYELKTQLLSIQASCLSNSELKDESKQENLK